MRGLSVRGLAVRGLSAGLSGLGRVGPAVGLVAARRAVQVSGPRRTLSHPVIIEVEPRENIAAGRFGWGLGPWAPAGSVHRVSASGRLLNGAGPGPADDTASVTGPGPVNAAGILAAAAGRSLVAVVRDAHRDEQNAVAGQRPARGAARPDPGGDGPAVLASA